MRSKFIKWGLMIGVAAMATSCSYFFDQKEEKKNSYNLTVDEKTGVSCVKKNSDLLKDYFDMKRDDAAIAAELRDMKGCIRDTVDLFIKHTRTSSAEPDTYTAKDIHEFLSQVFEEYKKTPQFMVDAFILKDSLLGGTPLKASKAEVKQIPDFVDFVYDALADLAVERHVLFKTDHAEDWDTFKPAAAKFLGVVSRINTLNIKKTGSFDYQSVSRIVMSFMDDPEDIDHWTKSLNLINSLQSLISSGQRDTLDITKFNFTVNELANLYMVYVEYYRYLKDDFFYADMATILTFPTLISRAVEDPEAYNGRKPDILNSVQTRLLKSLAHAADAGPNGQLSLDYLDTIILTLKENADLPDYINPDTLKGMFPQFFNVWLSPKGCKQAQQKGQGECFARFMNSAQVNELQRQLDQWRERQVWINQALGNVKTITRDNTAFVHRSQNPNIAALQSAVRKVNHMHWDGRYLIVGDKQLTFKDLVVFHNIYTLANLFLRPFNNNANKQQINDTFLYRDQALIFYQWFRQLGLELKLVDPRSSPDSTAAFDEINLFGSTAVEPTKLDLAELIEYFEISISTSFRAVDLVTQQFTKCHISKDLIDVFGYEKLDALCFRREWAQKHPEYLFNSMPRLTKYLKTTSDLQYKNLLNSLEKAARQGLIVNEPVETDTFRLLSSILAYAESLFTRFDADGDNLMAPNELKAALNHIVPSVSELLSKSVDPGTLKTLKNRFPKFEEDLITYILVKHELPGIVTSDTLAGALPAVVDLKLFAEWSGNKDKWMNNDAAVTREEVILVISGISALARVTKIKHLKQFFYDKELEFEKPLMGPQDPLLKPIAAELGCSYKVEDKMYQWLFENKQRYWNDVLDFIQPGQFVLFGWDPSSLGFSLNDIPEINDLEIKNVPFIGDVNLNGATKGWEGKVTYKLIELLSKDPELGPLCGVPFVPGVHHVALQQYYKQEFCENKPILLVPVRECHTYYRSPY